MSNSVFEVPNSPHLQLVDLFCGAGGLATGFTQAGVKTVLASDNWPPAEKTYRSNYPNHRFELADIRSLDLSKMLSSTVDATNLIVAGGPPCQGFSSAGARKRSDARNTLVSTFAEKAVSLRPAVIVFENVEGFLTLDSGRFVIDLLKPLIDSGYRVRLEKHNVANFGVPQLRKRVIGIAALGRNPEPLQETHYAHGMPGATLIAKEKPPVDGVLTCLQNASPLQDDPLNKKRELTGLDLERVQHIPPGGTMRDLPEALQHHSWNARANRRVSDGMPTERRGGAPVGMRRLVAGEPSKAITSAATREFIHPVEDRFLTQREAALLQTFPASYEFIGNRAEINTLIGNAIPPQFAKAIADSVIRTMSKTVDSSLRGGLDALRLTNSSGVSPALARTIELVESTFTRSLVEEPTLF